MDSSAEYRQLAKEYNDLNFLCNDLRTQLNESREAHMECARLCDDFAASNRKLSNELATLRKEKN